MKRFKQILIKIFKHMFIGGPGYGTDSMGPDGHLLDCECDKDYMESGGPW